LSANRRGKFPSYLQGFATLLGAEGLTGSGMHPLRETVPLRFENIKSSSCSQFPAPARIAGRNAAILVTNVAKLQRFAIALADITGVKTPRVLPDCNPQLEKKYPA
ncbi:MAG: hypothetical protein ACRD2G_05975, partial [Terriglobia bacterium]